MFYDHLVCKQIMGDANIMYIMIVKIRRNNFESELFVEEKKAIEIGFIIYVNGNQKQFIWSSHCNLSEETSFNSKDAEWTHHLSNRHNQMTEEINH